MPYTPKYPINYLPNGSGDSTAKMLRQLMYERNEIYDILNSLATGKLGSIKQACAVATTANINLSVGGLLTVDGIALTAGCRVLVWKQTDATQNGVYLSAVGAWTRSADADSSSDFADGAVISIEQGLSYGHGLFNMTTAPTSFVLGTNNLNFEYIYAGSAAVSAAQDAANDAYISANAAAASESTATTKAGEALTSAANALASATTATTKAGEASTSADSALVSANNAAASEANALASSNSANASANNSFASASVSHDEAERARVFADSVNPANWYLKSETYTKTEVDTIATNNSTGDRAFAVSKAKLWAIIFG